MTRPAWYGRLVSFETIAIMTSNSISTRLLSSVFVASLLSLASACSGGTGTDDGGMGGGDMDGGGVVTEPDAAIIRADCDSLPALPGTATATPWTSSEDFTFDGEGNLWGVSLEDMALHKISKDGTRTVVLPNVSSWGRGIRFLDGGDLVVAEPDSGSLLRITPDGSSSVILGNITEPNGIAIHPNNWVYLTSADGILYRVNPDTGFNTHIVNGGPSLDGVTFSPDYRTLYYNTEGGTVFSMPLDEEGVPEGSGQTFVVLPKIEILDGMTMDECGNLYVVEMTGIVWRVTPDKQVNVALDLSEGKDSFVFIAALNFGSGAGGWDAKSLYVMDLMGKIYEVPMGVAGKR